jgi:hypothetical protein
MVIITHILKYFFHKVQSLLTASDHKTTRTCSLYIQIIFTYLMILHTRAFTCSCLARNSDRNCSKTWVVILEGVGGDQSLQWRRAQNKFYLSWIFSSSNHLSVSAPFSCSSREVDSCVSHYGVCGVLQQFLNVVCMPLNCTQTYSWQMSSAVGIFSVVYFMFV